MPVISRPFFFFFFFLLLIGDMAEDILNDLNDRIASPQASMREKRISKLLFHLSM